MPSTTMPEFVLRPVLVGELDLAALRRLAQDQVERLLDREIGEAGERLGHPLERPQAGDVGERHEQRQAAFGAAQLRHEPGALAGGSAACSASRSSSAASGPSASSAAEPPAPRAAIRSR